MRLMRLTPQASEIIRSSAVEEFGLETSLQPILMQAASTGISLLIARMTVIGHFISTLSILAKEAHYLEWSMARLFARTIHSQWIDTQDDKPVRAEQFGVVGVVATWPEACQSG